MSASGKHVVSMGSVYILLSFILHRHLHLLCRFSFASISRASFGSIRCLAVELRSSFLTSNLPPAFCIQCEQSYRQPLCIAFSLSLKFEDKRAALYVK